MNHDNQQAARELLPGCDYQGYEFGGGYLDSVCINGCLRMHGAEMVELCKVCGQPDGEFASLCRCLEDEYPGSYLEDEES